MIELHDHKFRFFQNNWDSLNCYCAFNEFQYFVEFILNLQITLLALLKFLKNDILYASHFRVFFYASHLFWTFNECFY